jgi:hypothetical protein
MVCLSLPSLRPFGAIKQKAILKLTVVLSGLPLLSLVSMKGGRHGKETGMPRLS